MIVTAIRGEIFESDLEVEEVVLVKTAWSLTPEDVLGELLGVLGADKLVVLGSSDIDEALDGGRAIGGLEGCVVDGVAVDLADVEILFDLGNLFGDDPVGDSPDAVRG